MKTAKAKKVEETETEGQFPEEYRLVDLDLIVDHPKMEYREIMDEHAERLSQSIEADGLDTALLTWDGGDPDTKMKIDGEKFPASFLLAGQHRREALQRLRKRNKARFQELFADGVPTKIVHGDEEDAIAAQIRENAARENPKLSEILPLVKKLRKKGLKGKEIAKRVGKSKAWVSEVLSVEDELGEEGAEAASKGDLSIRDARKLKKAAKKAKKEGKKLDVKEEVEKIKSKKAGKKAKKEKIGPIKLLKRYNALPSMKVGAKLELLEAALEYLAGEREKLPEELRSDDEEESKSKKSKK